MDLLSDLLAVQRIERELLIDAPALRSELDRCREAPDRPSTFALEGGHVSVTALDTLRHVQQHGFVLLAELISPDGAALPAGYQYGLDAMPLCDRRFPNLCVEDLAIEDVDLKRARAEAPHTVCSWRIGVRRSCQRLGVALSLRSAALQLARQRGKTHVAANIASLCSTASGAAHCHNLASARSSRGILLPWARRHRRVRVLGEEGGPELWVAWTAYRNTVAAALERVEVMLRAKGHSLMHGGADRSEKTVLDLSLVSL